MWVTLTLLLIGASTGMSRLHVGVGIADTTGPCVGVPIMGYGKADQTTRGLLTRLFARAFVFSSSAEVVNVKLVIVVVDSLVVSPLIKYKVLERLSHRLGNSSVVTESNLMLSATHTHSGPGGFVEHTLLHVTSKGFVGQTFEAVVQGITYAVIKAMKKLRAAELYMDSERLEGASVNRSPISYYSNDMEELKLYNDDVDKTMSQLSIFDSNSDEPIGLINWFAVHPTSMNNTNRLVNGDNKGLASALMERSINPQHSRPGKGPFVAAFVSPSSGDVSPNTLGPRCLTTGQPCHPLHSTCEDNLNTHCIALGPGRDMTHSTLIIANKQFNLAKTLLERRGRVVNVDHDDLKAVHKTIDMANQRLYVPKHGWVRTCGSALGFSFAAGTTDGPGSSLFHQGMKSIHPVWKGLVKMVSRPSQAQRACHHPKPILLNTSEMDFPRAWHPRLLPVQMFRLGSLLLAAVPAELTTMAGRRLTRSIESAVSSSASATKMSVLITCLANDYSHYVTTYEEYEKQRYEGASTLFGPHTLSAYQKVYTHLTHELLNTHSMALSKSEPMSGPSLSELVSLSAPVPADLLPLAALGSHFGQCTKQPRKIIKPGQTATARFLAGNPRHHLMLGDSYLLVMRQDELSQGWTVIATDADFETRFIWMGGHVRRGPEVEVQWLIPRDAKCSWHKMVHKGFRKNIGGRLNFYRGESKQFWVQCLT